MSKLPHYCPVSVTPRLPLPLAASRPCRFWCQLSARCTYWHVLAAPLVHTPAHAHAPPLQPHPRSVPTMSGTWTASWRWCGSTSTW